MRNLKISSLDGYIIFFLSVSFIISNLHLFFVGVYSNAPMYAYLKGDVEWWVYTICLMLNLGWLTIMAIVLGMSKIRVSPKQALMIAAYGYSLYKDIYDWMNGQYTDTRYTDWIITILLFGFVQFIFWIAKKLRENNS